MYPFKPPRLINANRSQDELKSFTAEVVVENQKAVSMIFGYQKKTS